MKIGVVYPQTEFGNDPKAIRDYAQTVEDLGFAHIVAYDHVLGANPDRPGGWKGPYTFTSGVHSEIPVRATGNYVGIRAESTDDNTWALANLEIHWSPSGNRGNGV